MDQLSPQSNKKVKLKDGTVKVYSYQRPVRKQVQLDFQSEAEKLKFDEKLNNVRSALGLKRNTEVFQHLVDMNFSNELGPVEPTGTDPLPLVNNSEAAEDNLAMYGCTSGTVQELVHSAEQHARKCSNPLNLKRTVRHGHVLEAEFCCAADHKTEWHSSPKTGGNYLLNFRIFLAFLCSGMLPIQYQKFCDFVNLGHLTKRLFKNFMDMFSTLVGAAAELSMTQALNEEIVKNDNDRTINIMTDARHPCRTNSHRTDVPALGQITHKVLAYAMRRNEERCTQKHERVGVEHLFEQFKDKNVKIGNLAHDRNLSVNKYVREHQQETQNTNEKWHAAKPVVP